MEYPSLKDIFWENDFKLEMTSEIAELDRTINGYLNKLVKKKSLSDPEAERIGELVGEFSEVSRAAGFEQGFRCAVKLLLD